MRKLFLVSFLLLLVIGATVTVAAAKNVKDETTTASIVKVLVIGPEGKMLTLGSQETGTVTIQAGDSLILMGMARKQGTDPLNFTLVSEDPLQQLVTQAFRDKAWKQTRTIHYNFTPDQPSSYTFYFNVTNTSAVLDWAELDVQVT
jgi:hypothetical protein